MQKFKIKYLFLLIVICLSFNCHQWSEDYSILESSPYVDYGTNNIPEIIDGPTGSAFGFGGNYIYTTTDTDTSIDVLGMNALFRKRLGRIVEVGFTGTLMYKEKMFPYGVFDTRFQLSKQPISISPDFGIGAGRGREKWSFDLRFSTIISYSIVKNRLNLYFVPKIIWFHYAYHAAGTEVGTSSVYYATSNIYGFGAGLCFTLLESTEQHGRTQKLRIKPEVNYVMGQEPKLDQIDFSVLQIGLQLLYAY